MINQAFENFGFQNISEKFFASEYFTGLLRPTTLPVMVPRNDGFYRIKNIKKDTELSRLISRLNKVGEVV